MIEIKKLGMEHFEPIVAFDKLCFPTDFWKEEDFKELLSDERTTYYAAMDGDIIAADVFIYNWQGKQDYVKIMNVAVHPDYRKRGLAKRLLNLVTEEMLQLGMKRFCGETRASNFAMQHTFESCGYKHERTVENCYENPTESAFKYVLQL